MKSLPGVVAKLNVVLGDQLVAINQYFLHARMYKNEGLDELNEAAYKQSILKMKQADWVIERILLLEGLPNLQDLGALKIGEQSEERLQADMDYEHGARDILVDAIAFCEQAGDYVSRELIEKLLHNTEEQIDWIEAQQHLIKHAGIQNYLQSQMSSDH